MCRTVHALLQTAICGIQMLVRVFMTVILMIENVIRMVLQTLYNFISFMLQMISLIPICLVFLATARLKCFMCGGGGPCPVARGGACDCLMSAMAIFILALIFRATGTLDKIFFSLGYAKYRPPMYTRFVPTPGDITECSRNDTETTTVSMETESTTALTEQTESTTPEEYLYYDTDYLYYPYDYSVRLKLTSTKKPTSKSSDAENDDDTPPDKDGDDPTTGPSAGDDDGPTDGQDGDDDNSPNALRFRKKKIRRRKKIKVNKIPQTWTTVLYYLI